MHSRLSDRSRQRLRTITIILATALVIAPAAALAGHQFNDVPASNVFHDDIDWMADNGVTKGCNPPANTEYCPDDFVTREQMAAFMHRLETEGVFLPADAKAADADKLDGKNSTAFLGADAKAADADKLDGKNSTAFLGVNAKAADADKFDGLDSAALAAPAVAETTLDSADSLPFNGTDTALVTVDITLPDHCGDGSTRHRVLAYGSYMLYLNDNNAWATGRMEIHDEADGATIDGFLPYTGQLYLSSENGEDDPLSTLSEQRLFTNVEPGVVTYELLADVDTVRTSTTSLAWNDPVIRVQSLGWTCGPHAVSQATNGGGGSIYDAD